jgi:hypothetical protein
MCRRTGRDIVDNGKCFVRRDGSARYTRLWTFDGMQCVQCVFNAQHECVTVVVGT